MAENGTTADAERRVILTPDQRLRVFVSSTLQELAGERAAAHETIDRLRLTSVMFELGARPHPPRDLYRAYLDQSHIFIGIYWQSYGWVAPDMAISGLEDEYRLSGNRPKLIYVKTPAPDREPRLKELLGRIKADDTVSYKSFSSATELGQLIADDLALLLTERFQASAPGQAGGPDAGRPGVGGLGAAVRPKFNNLPAQSTPLVGREQDVERVCNLLRRSEVRMVTLLGPGGIGKTRLALAAADRLLEHFADGVCLVALESARDPQLVPSAIAHALGVRETDAGSLLQTLKHFLADRRLLLVLDNFEQVVDAAPVIAELLSASPQLDVLVTSRVVLRLSGEHEYAVPALDVPDLERLPDVERLVACTAVRLFVERARAVKSDFVVTPQNAPAVAAICHRLDGLPLAIELAAARARLLTPEAMLARLAGGHASLKLLAGGARDHPSRQQTLRNTVEWSHGLLDPAEQRLFAVLSVFAGGCSLDAVPAVFGERAEDADLLDLMSSLVDKSLVVQGQASPVDGEPRFSMLQVIREFGLERLDASGQAEVVRRRHAAYFIGLARRADPEIRGSHQMAWLARLIVEHDNMRAVLRWSLDRGDGAAATELIWSLWLFWLINAHLQEAQQWAEEALARVDALQPALRARDLAIAGGMACWRGMYDQAQRYMEEALALCQDDRDRGIMLSTLGVVRMSQGEHDLAAQLFDQSLDLCRRLGDNWCASVALNGIGRLATSQARYEQAERLYAESLSLSTGIGDKLTATMSLFDLAAAAMQQGNYTRAAALYKQTAAFSSDLRYKEGLAWCLEGLAGVAAGQGDAARAARLLGAADALRRAAGASVWRVNRKVHDQIIASTRASLAPEVFDSAWAEGGALSLEQAIGLALQDVSPA